jgi:hypothetical protein
MTALYREVVRELRSLDALPWLTPYLGERKALLEQLRQHLDNQRPDVCPCGSGRPPFNIADDGEPAEWRCPACTPAPAPAVIPSEDQR